MRWIWIDRITEFEPGRRCVAVKNVSLAEEVLHDHFAAAEGLAAQPLLPNTLVIEGMAQTAGILVGQMSGFSRNVILAKISRAVFVAVAGPGHTLEFAANLDRFDDVGAATSGVIERIDSVCGRRTPMGWVDLLFSHVEVEGLGARVGALSGDVPPQFVFTGALMDLLRLERLRPVQASGGTGGAVS